MRIIETDGMLSYSNIIALLPPKMLVGLAAFIHESIKKEATKAISVRGDNFSQFFLLVLGA